MIFGDEGVVFIKLKENVADGRRGKSESGERNILSIRVERGGNIVEGSNVSNGGNLVVGGAVL